MMVSKYMSNLWTRNQTYMTSPFLAPSRPKSALVYNCTTGGINPFHWGEIGTYTGIYSIPVIPVSSLNTHHHQSLCPLACLKVSGWCSTTLPTEMLAR